ncbi:hypothetical protein [Mesorhizobium sp. WSM4887]|uniref:hypothetical protein n=1 Tax=Mesorhizobium sp. WSM4887 TaxID=3038543 RepID=UPI0024175FF4|nr:hypothetical protein [Mesorhizobium sp. WSM4887]MDG4890921.1 hypothetical protein [Mesorhizobium sp. WSM4887]
MSTSAISPHPRFTEQDLADFEAILETVTPRQADFLRAYYGACRRNASLAARVSGFASSREQAKASGYQLTKKRAAVVKAIKAIDHLLNRRALYGVAEAIADLEADRELARSKGAAGASLRATERLCQLHGLLDPDLKAAPL